MSFCNGCQKNCRTSFVYVMTGRGDGCVKVGYAASTSGRVASLRKQFGQPIKVHARFPMQCELQASMVEGRAHDLLDTHRQDGEWFRCAEADATKAIEAAIRWEKAQ